jgi:hypothetical protein
MIKSYLLSLRFHIYGRGHAEHAQKGNHSKLGHRAEVSNAVQHLFNVNQGVLQAFQALMAAVVVAL